MKFFPWPWARVPDEEEDALLVGGDPRDVGSIGIHLASGPIARSALALWGGEGGGIETAARGGALPSPLLRVVLSTEDWRQVTEVGRRAWATGASDTVRRLIRQHGTRGPWPEEGPCIVFSCDGGSDLYGHRIGLKPGEFATVCVDNLWPSQAQWKHAPTPRLWRAVYVSTPHTGDSSVGAGGFWQGQPRWTLGRHWLDSAYLPTLSTPSALTIEPNQDGSFGARVAPDLELERSTVPSGTQLLVRRQGTVLLRVLVEDPREVSPTVTAAAPRARAHATLDELIAVHPAELAPAKADRGHATLFGADVEIPAPTLVEHALLLPPIHFPDLFEGYERAVDVDGAPCALDSGVASVIFHVRSDRIEVEGRRKEATLDGRALQPGKPTVLHLPCTVEVGRCSLRVEEPPEPLRTAARAVIRGREVTWPLEWGRLFTVGRAARSHVRLLDSRSLDGLLWKSAYKNAESVPSGGTMLPRSQFRLDAIMTSSRHVEIDLQGAPQVRTASARGRAWHRRGNHAALLRTGESPTLEAGDELWIGHQAFRVETDGRGLSYALPTTAKHLIDVALEAARRFPSVNARPNSPVPAPHAPEPKITLIPAAQPAAGATDTPIAPPRAVASLSAPPVADNAARAHTWERSSTTSIFDPTDIPVRPPPPPTRTMPTPVAPRSEQPPARASSPLVTDEQSWDWELSRPYLLRLEGWVVEGDASVGPRTSDLIALPVLDASQADLPPSYALVRTNRQAASFVRADGVRGVEVSEEGAVCSIERYTPTGELDHRFVLMLERPTWSINPRTWLVRFSGNDPVAQAMLHRGVEVGSRRALTGSGADLEVEGLPERAGVRVRDRSAAQRSVHVDTGSGRLHALAGESVVPVGGLVRVGAMLFRVDAA